ncbi:MAG: hypothetical protein J6R73_06060, partial [Alistipes sp.]|nr:hypothetical protein [Alistipes sp.]
ITLVRGQKNAELRGYWQVKLSIVRGNISVNGRDGLHVNYGSASQTMPIEDVAIERNLVMTNNPSDYLVNYVEVPRPDIEWKNNTFYGGRFKGIEFPTIGAAPRIPNVAVSVENIRRNAGVSW